MLSSDNLLASGGGVVFQPAQGKAAGVGSYGTSYVIGAGIQLLALPLVLLVPAHLGANRPADCEDDRTGVTVGCGCG